MPDFYCISLYYPTSLYHDPCLHVCTFGKRNAITSNFNPIHKKYVQSVKYFFNINLLDRIYQRNVCACGLCICLLTWRQRGKSVNKFYSAGYTPPDETATNSKFITIHPHQRLNEHKKVKTFNIFLNNNNNELFSYSDYHLMIRSL